MRFRWVKGHGADPMNDLVDRLAVEAALTQQSRRGDRPPEVVGPPDLVARGPAAAAGGAEDVRVPAGRRLVVAGHKPPELGGYGDNPVAAGVRRRLEEVLAAKRELHPDLVVLTGLGLGAEQLGAEAALAAGVPYVAVLPYPAPDAVWPAASRQRFAGLLAGAKVTVVLQPKAPESKQGAGAALARRDAWLARHAHEAVAVWDGEDALVGRAVRSLQDHVGEEDVWLLAP